MSDISIFEAGAVVPIAFEDVAKIHIRHCSRRQGALLLRHLPLIHRLKEELYLDAIDDFDLNNFSPIFTDSISSDAFILDLRTSLTSDDQTSFALQNRHDGLVSPDLIVGAILTLPELARPFGPCILRSTPNGGYYPIFFLHPSQILTEDFILERSFVSAVILSLLDRIIPLSSRVFSFDLFYTNDLTMPITCDVRSLMNDARNFVTEMITVFNQVRHIPHTDNITEKVLFLTPEPLSDCHLSCILHTTCLSNLDQSLLVHDKSFKDFFQGFNTFSQILRISQRPVDPYDPEHLRLSKLAALECDRLDVSILVKNG